MLINKALKYYKPYKKLFIIDILCAVSVAILEMVFPNAVSYIVDEIIPKNNFSLVIYASFGLFAVYLITMLLYFVIQYWGEKLGVYIENDIRLDLFDHLQKLHFSFYDNNKTGQLISRISNDLQMIGVVAHYAPEQFLVASTMLIITLIILAQVNWVLSLIIIFMVFIILFVNIFFTRKTVNAMRELNNSAGKISSKLQEVISGIRLVQSYSNESYQLNLFTKESAQYCSNQNIGFKEIAKCNAITYYLTKSLPIIAIIGGAYSVIYNGMSNGTFFSFILLTNLVLKPIEMLGSFAARFPKGIAGFKTFTNLMSIQPEIKDRSDAKSVNQLQGDICFKNISFNYETDTPVLKNISIRVKEGETVGFVGYSGSGKSTICNLIPRFYDANSGSISIGTRDIKNIKLKSLRENIGVVMQDVFLFSGTIEENLKIAKRDATEEELYTALKLANLLNFVEEQPDKLKTVIGERGVKISGGEKQRLGIARMFLKNPSILILDEATSSLDADNEKAIHNALNELSRGRTTLIIAHRFSTLTNADRIYVVNNGEIESEGTHNQLLETSEIYRNLYRSQQEVANFEKD